MTCGLGTSLLLGLAGLSLWSLEHVPSPKPVLPGGQCVGDFGLCLPMGRRGWVTGGVWG